MLGKQWLNRYQSTDMRGTAIERSQNRQRKLDGVITWYFDYVMESLPLMLQGALLLLGCALSRYLWMINVTIATVVLSITSLGVLFYVFIVIAGTISENCPYQTPGARIFRPILLHYILPAFTKFSRFVRKCACYDTPREWWSVMERPWYSLANVTNTLLYFTLWLFVAPIDDVYHLGRGALRLLKRMYHLPLAPFRRRLYHWFMGNFSLRTHGRGQQTIMLDLRCVSWVLQTSLDKIDHLSAFNHLWSMPELGGFDPILVIDCFNSFNSCTGVSNGKLVIMGGLENLATMAARGLFRTICHLTVTNPTSSTLADLRRRYHKAFPPWTDLSVVPFNFTMDLIHTFIRQPWDSKSIKWDSRRLPPQEQIPFARSMVEAAKLGHQQTQGRKVPRWILRFALDSLSQDPPSPTPVIASCLAIIAVDLGCDFLNITPFYKRYVQLRSMSTPLTKV
jgi:hypothetical protein